MRAERARGGEEEEKRRRGDDEKAHGTDTDGTGETTANGQKSPKAPTPLHIHLRSFGGMDEKTLVPNASRCRPPGFVASRCRDGEAKEEREARRRGKKHEAMDGLG